jgi:hypothetical protein
MVHQMVLLIHYQHLTQLEISYVTPYVERHGRDLKDPWSLRQVGVYHQTTAGETSRWVFIDLKSHAESYLNDLLSDSSEKPEVAIHALLAMHLCKNWADYVEYLANELGKYVSNFVCSVSRP